MGLMADQRIQWASIGLCQLGLFPKFGPLFLDFYKKILSIHRKVAVLLFLDFYIIIGLYHCSEALQTLLC